VATSRHPANSVSHSRRPPLASSEASRWLDAFFAAYYERRPVNATFIGVHEHDGGLPDFSEAGAGDTLAEMRGLLARLPPAGAAAGPADAPAGSPADPATEALDLRLAAGFLRIQIQEYESRHFHRGNPSMYTGEAVFGVLSLFLTEYAPLADRVARAIDRLHAVPRLLEQGRENIRRAPTAWTERAIRECDGALALFRDGLRLAAGEAALPAASRSALAAAAEIARDAFGEHRNHLAGELLGAPRDDIACGEEMLSLYLREGHFVTETPDELLARATSELEEARARLREGAAAFGSTEPAEVLAALRDLHPSAEGYLDRHQEIFEEMRAFAIDRDFVTWPESPVRFVPRPPWVREAAPFLYFLVYRSPAAFDPPPVHEVLVPPIEASLPAAEQRALLRATNDSVIKLNHVIHHAGIGHHVQNVHAARARSRIGRIAAVDCASPIAMFCGGTMAEGWACYATDLMREAGALTPLEACSELNTRTRMCARAVVDVSLHTGRLDLEGAAAFYEREAGMSAAAARAEAVRNSMFPGTAAMYLLGTDGIHALRRDMEAARGPDFDLKSFHDELLSYGSVPVALVGERMRASVAC